MKTHNRLMIKTSAYLLFISSTIASEYHWCSEL